MTRTARAGPGRAGSFLANVVQMEIGAPGQALSQDQALLFYYLEVAAPPPLPRPQRPASRSGSGPGHWESKKRVRVPAGGAPATRPSRTPPFLPPFPPPLARPASAPLPPPLVPSFLRSKDQVKLR